MLVQCVAAPEAIGNITRVRQREATLAKISKAENSPQPQGAIRFFLEFRSSKVRLFDVRVCAYLTLEATPKYRVV